MAFEEYGALLEVTVLCYSYGLKAGSATKLWEATDTYRGRQVAAEHIDQGSP